MCQTFLNEFLIYTSKLNVIRDKEEIPPTHLTKNSASACARTYRSQDNSYFNATNFRRSILLNQIKFNQMIVCLNFKN